MSDPNTPPSPQSPAPFDANKPHMAVPKLRPVRLFPAQSAPDAEGNVQQAVGIADARQISDRVVFAAPAVQLILPMLDGQKTIDEIVAAVGRGLTRPTLEQFVAQLDDAALLDGPTFDALLSKIRADFDSSDTLPPAASAAFAEQLGASEMGEEAAQSSSDERYERGAARMPSLMDQWIDEVLKKADRPSFDTLPRAIMAPHIDYGRGWMNYASVWGRMRVVDRPARVVILGTNHFGTSTGVCLCDKGYETPLGTSPLARDLFDALKKHLGQENAARALANRYDHEREHSVELQVPWIQHCLGLGDNGSHVPVLGILVHDPSVASGASYDGQGLDFDSFIKALRAAIADLEMAGMGKTLLVASVDLSHVGTVFGDEGTLAGDEQEQQQKREKILNHDREMLQLFEQGKIDEMLASMAWQQNPTRWCSLGAMAATLKTLDVSSKSAADASAGRGSGGVRLLNYVAAMDDQGLSLVSHAAAVIE